MTDRELLEAAVRAAGIAGKYCAEDESCVACIYVTDELDCAYGWNPLTDDGDALRLAVKLGLLGAHGMELEFVVAMGEETEAERQAATRRAIVLAAAEIGA